MKVKTCTMCDGHGMDEFQADRVEDYRYLPCMVCGGLGRVHAEDGRRITKAEIAEWRAQKAATA